jgi:hypothetical protein
LPQTGHRFPSKPFTPSGKWTSREFLADETYATSQISTQIRQLNAGCTRWKTPAENTQRYNMDMDALSRWRS